MLVRYKKALEKIAMGLISLMPQEKDVKRLMDTMQQYEQDENWVLYLWKNGEEYVGIVGLLVDGTDATIQHITVIPSYRGEGVALEMLQELRDSGPYKTFQGNDETASFLQKYLPLLTEDNK